ncbi:MAG TPA: TetR/AcrR family transcriptional regulator [Acidimicrobiales bacterium]|nr:TetR/AcrR family transcriptional regulator [Acidimicrobiales bacterium]
MTGSPARRPRARKGEGDRLREEILQATERLLVRTGDQDAVSIRAIADVVGVSPPSIYLHFADKSELFFAVSARHFLALDEAIESAATAATDPIDELRLRGRAYVRFGLDHPEPYRILFMTRPSAQPATWTSDAVLENAAFAHHVDAVQRAIDAGAFPGDVDAFLVATGLWAAVHGVVSLLITQPDFPWPDVEVLVDHMLATQANGVAGGGRPADGPSDRR